MCLIQITRTIFGQIVFKTGIIPSMLAGIENTDYHIEIVKY